jgi:type IV pilus assembly protein PilA
MLNWFARRLKEVHEKDAKGEKGFTLIELLVVVIIIGILAAIAIPVFLNQRQKAQEAKVESDVRNTVSAYEQAYAQDNAYPAAGTYTSAAPIQDAAGNNLLTPSDGDSIVTTVAGGGYTVTGTNPGTGFTSYSYDSTTGAYTTTL